MHSETITLILYICTHIRAPVLQTHNPCRHFEAREALTIAHTLKSSLSFYTICMHICALVLWGHNPYTYIEACGAITPTPSRSSSLSYIICVQDKKHLCRAIILTHSHVYLCVHISYLHTSVHPLYSYTYIYMHKSYIYACIVRMLYKGLWLVRNSNTTRNDAEPMKDRCPRLVSCHHYNPKIYGLNNAEVTRIAIRACTYTMTE